MCCGCRPAMHIFKLLDFNNGFRSVGPATGLMVLRTLSGSSGSPGKICRGTPVLMKWLSKWQEWQVVLSGSLALPADCSGDAMQCASYLLHINLNKFRRALEFL